MAKNTIQTVADLAHRYVDSLKMWGVDDSPELWREWVMGFLLSNRVRDHTRKVVDTILEE